MKLSFDGTFEDIFGGVQVSRTEKNCYSCLDIEIHYQRETHEARARALVQ